MSEKRFKSYALFKGKKTVYCDNEAYTNEEVAELLNEQQATINELEKNFDDLTKWASEIAKRNVVLDEKIGQLQRENEQLRQQLQCNKMSKSVCSVCKNHRLEQVSDKYYVSKCEKGHNECSKTMLRCCEDFEVLNDE